jgi:hypothetical protein
MGVTVLPAKADSPLVIAADAVLPLPVSLESLQLVPRQTRERPEILSRVQHAQLAKSLPLDGLKPTHRLAAEQALGLGCAARPDHSPSEYRLAFNVKR